MLSFRIYLASATAALMVSWILSGCRIGNKVELPQNPDQISGYYNTEPQYLTFCATHASSKCLDAPVNQIPAIISSAISNPVALIVKQLSTGEAYLTNVNGSGDAIGITATEDGRLALSGLVDATELWVDEGCYRERYIEEDGNYSKSSATATIGEKSLQISGRIELKLRFYEKIEGSNCANTRNVMHACYLDPAKCQGGTTKTNAFLHSWVKDLFDPYINAGVMTADDIPTASAVGFDVLYK